MMQPFETEKRYPGIWRLRFGVPEPLTPDALLREGERRELFDRPEAAFPFQGEIRWRQLPGGVAIELPLGERERVYGLGLQLGSFCQNGRRKRLCTNADAPKDTGDSHAPAPFYLSSLGYGVLVDTARCVEFDFGAACRLAAGPAAPSRQELAADTDALYRTEERGRTVTVWVPGVRGVDLLLFAAADMAGALERYNLYAGGGALPPIWGLGPLYRCYTKADQREAEGLLEGLLADKMPVSILGLEPGWQSHAYSCSFRWDRGRFPQPERLIAKARQAGVELNLWEQCFVHPTAERYQALLPYAGDYQVWGGLAPDLACPEAAALYGERQGELIDMGVSGFKVDECDGSDFTGNWFFPSFSRFPSGLCGETERNLYGALAQRAVNREFEKRGRRTFSQVRANWSYGAPMGFVLYSDLYGHREFIRGIVNASLSGLLWSPEVRQCGSAGELIRRMQTAVFSPMLVVNAWMIPSPPWKQFDIARNLAGELLPDDSLLDACRALLELRNRFIPYLYAAFGRYCATGRPPFRPLVLDYPEDQRVWETDDAYLMGESLLVAPILEGERGREVYLPQGVWYDFWTEERLEGGRAIWVERPEIPLYVKENTLLPLGSGERVTVESVVPLTLTAYGPEPGKALLLDDDRESLDYRRNGLEFAEISVENGRLQGPALRGYTLGGLRFAGKAEGRS